MGSIQSLKPNIPISRPASWNVSYEPTTVSEVANERIVEATVRAFNHFSANPSARSEYEKRLTRELMAHVTLLLARRPEHAHVVLEVLLDNYRYYCRTVKEWTLLDITIEMLVKNIESCSGALEKVEILRTLVERRALMALIAGPSA